MEDKISVIVPVYNVAEYLPQCVESILNQDYSNLEVILIDDGSTDNSGRICDLLAAQDGRIRVIHQKNGGAAAAKNAGLRAATGGYLTFVDSDDYLEPNVYRYMVDTLNASDADAAEFSFRFVFRSHSEDHAFPQENVIVDGPSYLKCYLQDWVCALLWNKLYKRSLFEGVFFEEGHKIDDEYFTYQGMMKAKRIVRDNRVIYNYRQRASSVMQSPASKHQILLDRVDCLNKRRINVIKHYPEFRRLFNIGFLEMLTFYIKNENCSAEHIAFIKKQIRDYFREKGCTIPPGSLGRSLLHIYYSSTEKLLTERNAAQSVADTTDLFE